MKKKNDKLIFKESHLEIQFSGWTKLITARTRLIIPYHSIKVLEFSSYERPKTTLSFLERFMPKRIEGTFFHENYPCFVSVESGKKCLHMELKKGVYRNVYIEASDAEEWAAFIADEMKTDKERVRKQKIG